MMKSEAVVLFPCAAVGHLISMVELGKLLVSHRPSLSVHILIVHSKRLKVGSSPLPDLSAAASAATASCPTITLHTLTADLPPDFSPLSRHVEALAFAVHRHLNPEIRKTLLSISGEHRVLGLVVDFFCSAAQEVAGELSVPCYYFSPSGAGFICLLVYLSVIHEKYTNEVYTDPETLLEVAGIPPLPVPDLIESWKDRTDKAYEGFVETSRNVAKSAGIVVNTFERFEPEAVQALRDGQHVPNGPAPPVFCIGPLVLNRKPETGSSEILGWLDSQPSRSVILLCFGSLGVFSIAQLKEMAVGLERTGKRFLWVVRNPLPETDQGSGNLEPDGLDSLFPEGFLDRTKERGLVVKDWVPQVAVLNHGSVGVFVTHCGWNSILEAVSAGVPMIGWPLYAEQRLNRILLVEEMKIAVSMNRSENGLVSAVEVENRVNELMESAVGESMRKRVIELKEEAEAALSPGGLSRVALVQLVDSFLSGA